ncbi:aldo-keto reductase family [Phaffia rhodozyma]|uniref:Aldo-keto reductase family n=1 Tax=Phaffia rhodozyma TaxID=264483 RepID=A0A0F7SR71_PHARH|nr:aldo-keto reductase family [Phaffia rhodozyma]
MSTVPANPLLDSSVIPTIDTRVQLRGRDGDVAVPVMATGTWAWGDSQIWDYKEEDFENIKLAFLEALEQQGGFFDTAEVYAKGESERIIGRIIKSLTPEQRAKIHIATKWLPIPSPSNPFFFTPGLVSGLKKSLARLGLDSVDLYQIHGPIGFHSWEAQGRELAECVKQGLTKTVGVSNFSKEQLIKISDVLESHGVPLASNQIELNLIRQYPLRSGLIEEMNKRGVVCLAYSPLAQGRLTGKYSAANPPTSGRRFSNIPMNLVDPLVEGMREIAEKRNVSIGAIALNWVLSKGAIPLGGAKNASQAKQNAQALGFRLTEEEITRLETLGLEGTKTTWWQKG